MNTNHNRIKVSDLEVNQPNKTLVTNANGELEFSEATASKQDLQSVLETGNYATKNIWIGNEGKQIFVGAESEDAVQLGSGDMAGLSHKSTFIGKNAGNGTIQEMVTALGYYAGAGNQHPRAIILGASGSTVYTTAPNQLAIGTNEAYKTIRFNTDVQTDLDLNFPSTSGTLVTSNNFKTVNGESIVGTGNIDLSKKQDIANQVEVSTSQTIPSNWHGKTVLFTTSCTITVPASLLESFIFNGITLPGASVTWAITAPHTWLFGTPSITAEKQIFTFTKRGNTNSILLLGV
ncbi:hypothetical protein L1276_002641 [Flavobacterium sp. HSC-32F16]|uniref:hypothetical protein n=1 Tax=Flavobacterium sp. HSC-32F16 TaxID=2910964 RepID=UPI0020A4473C|nr:hypothetical protein [Flavobacterium sp. HSC-32F16]MCP2027484.1 hypothetical protein [Flavobacterium sp. HSC-32F16]